MPLSVAHLARHSEWSLTIYLSHPFSLKLYNVRKTRDKMLCCGNQGVSSSDAMREHTKNDIVRATYVVMQWR